MKRNRIIQSIIISIIILTAVSWKNSIISKAEFIKRETPPKLNEENYDKISNPYMQAGLFDNGNCTWYAWGRAAEILGYELPNQYMQRTTNVASHKRSFRGNAKHWWYDNQELYNNDNGFKYGNEPKQGAIAVWDGCGGSGCNAGHVAMVEEISGDNVVLTESSFGGVWYSNSYWGLREYTIKQLLNMTCNICKNKMTFLGYIYLTEEDNIEYGIEFSIYLGSYYSNIDTIVNWYLEYSKGETEKPDNVKYEVTATSKYNKKQVFKDFTSETSINLGKLPAGEYEIKVVMYLSDNKKIAEGVTDIRVYSPQIDFNPILANKYKGKAEIGWWSSRRLYTSLLKVEIGQKFNIRKMVGKYYAASEGVSFSELPKDSKCTYKSSNTKIATVDKKGNVTPKKTGKVDITVSTEGWSGSCEIRVSKKSITVKKDVKDAVRKIKEIDSKYKKISKSNRYKALNDINKLENYFEKLTKKYGEMELKRGGRTIAPIGVVSSGKNKNKLIIANRCDYSRYGKLNEYLNGLYKNKKHYEKIKSVNAKSNSKTIKVTLKKKLSSDTVFYYLALSNRDINPNTKKDSKSSVTYVKDIYKDGVGGKANSAKITLKPNSKTITIKTDKKLKKGKYRIGIFDTGEETTFSVK